MELSDAWAVIAALWAFAGVAWLLNGTTGSGLTHVYDPRRKKGSPDA